MHPIAQVAGSIFVAAATAQALGLFGGGSPTLLSPSPFPLVMFGFRGVPFPLLPFLPAAGFLLWNPRTLLGQMSRAGHFPRRTWALLGVLMLLSAAWFALGWRYGVEYEGFTFTVWSAVFSAVLGVATFTAARAATRTQRFVYSWLAHVILFAWAGTYAFPYLGEVP